MRDGHHGAVPRRITPETDPNDAGPSLRLRLTLVATVLAATAGWLLGTAGAPALVVVSAIALLGLVWLALAIPGRARNRVLRERYPEYDVVEVLAATDLRATLRVTGFLEPGALRRWHTLVFSLVLSDTGFTVWRGGRNPVQVCAVPWPFVRDIAAGTATLPQAGPRPVAGLAIGTPDWRVNLVPLRRVGAMSPGAGQAIDRLIAAVRAHRDASTVTLPSTPPRRPPANAPDGAHLASWPDAPRDAITAALKTLAADLRTRLAPVADVITSPPDRDGHHEGDATARPLAIGAVTIWWGQTADALRFGIGLAGGWELARDEHGVTELRQAIDAVVAGDVELGRGLGVWACRLHLPDGTSREDCRSAPPAAQRRTLSRPQLQWSKAAPYSRYLSSRAAAG